jgi:hypothetical protein
MIEAGCNKPMVLISLYDHIGIHQHFAHDIPSAKGIETDDNLNDYYEYGNGHFRINFCYNCLMPS